VRVFGRTQCTVRFRPEEAGVSRGELLIKYDDGDVVSAELAGMAVEAEVGLNVDFVQCQPTFISCTNQKSFKVVNHSSEVISFAFKQHQYAEEDQAAQLMATMDLADATATAASASMVRERSSCVRLLSMQEGCQIYVFTHRRCR